MNVTQGVSTVEPTTRSTNLIVKMLNDFSARACGKQNSGHHALQISHHCFYLGYSFISIVPAVELDTANFYTLQITCMRVMYFSEVDVYLNT